MNFGERLKQIRTEKGLTQPQFAQMAGIEQSYLSKLENDKSVPSAEMFDTILAGLGMDQAAFLKEIDADVLGTTLAHIPAVHQFTAKVATGQVRDTRRWLFGAAAAWVLGFGMMLAANDGIFFSNKVYKYSSPGVVHAGEAENVFDTHKEILLLKLEAKSITIEELARDLADFKANRVRPLSVELPDYRGAAWVERTADGHRRFELDHADHVQAPGNRVLQFLGALVLVSGFVGLFIEWRLRRLKPKRRST